MEKGSASQLGDPREAHGSRLWPAPALASTAYLSKVNLWMEALSPSFKINEYILKTQGGGRKNQKIRKLALYKCFGQLILFLKLQREALSKYGHEVAFRLFYY